MLLEFFLKLFQYTFVDKILYIFVIILICIDNILFVHFFCFILLKLDAVFNPPDILVKKFNNLR